MDLEHLGEPCEDCRASVRWLNHRCPKCGNALVWQKRGRISIAYDNHVAELVDLERRVSACSESSWARL
jgi:predicted amidophosphoribosyltransferase